VRYDPALFATTDEEFLWTVAAEALGRATTWSPRRNQGVDPGSHGRDGQTGGSSFLLTAFDQGGATWL
jgi:hypothetical protein